MKDEESAERLLDLLRQAARARMPVELRLQKPDEEEESLVVVLHCGGEARWVATPVSREFFRDQTAAALMVALDMDFQGRRLSLDEDIQRGFRPPLGVGKVQPWNDEHS